MMAKDNVTRLNGPIRSSRWLSASGNFKEKIMLLKLVLSLTGFFFIGLLSVGIMIFGWGMKPISWGWIIWGYLATSVIGAMFTAAGDRR